MLDALTVRLYGKPAAATSVYRKRVLFYNALGLGAERRLLPSDPVDLVQWTAPNVAEAVDRRVVARPEHVRTLLDAVRCQPRRGEYLVAFFGCRCYAGMRPAEVVALRAGDCELPACGVGTAPNLLGQNPGQVRNGPTTVKLATSRAQASSLQHGQDRANPT